VKTVGDLLELAYGKALKAEARSGGSVPVVGSGGVVGAHSEAITTDQTIVVGRKGSIGSVTWVDGPAWPIDTAYYVKLKTAGLDLRWVYWLLTSLPLASMNKSAAVPGLNRDDVYRLPVSVPALDEQRRIAAILDRADAIRTKRRQALAHLDSLAETVFEAMFSGISTRVPLAQLGVDFVSGKNVLGDDSDAHPKNRVIKVSAISSGRFIESESKPMPRGYAPPESHLIRNRDILFGRASGSLDLLGATAVVDSEPAHLYLPDKVWKLSAPLGDQIEPTYILGVLRSTHARAYIKHNASGAAGVRNISKARVLKYRAPLAPVHLQRQFASRVERIESDRTFVQRALAADDELFTSLQSRAFRGEL
jgi:type I restriction enzyme S subunit